MPRRWFSAIAAPLLLCVGCAATEPAPPRAAMTRKAYMDWRAKNLLRAESDQRTFAQVVETPEGEWPGHLKGRTVVFQAIWLETDTVTVRDPLQGRPVRIVLLADPERSDRETRLCLDDEDYAADRFRFDNLASRSGEWRGTPVKVTAYMTGVAEDPAHTPWIGRVLAVEAAEPR